MVVLPVNKFRGAAEAAALLLIARSLRAGVPLRTWSGLLGQSGSAAGIDVRAGDAGGREGEIALALARAAHRLPGTYTCFDRAVAGQLMLRLRALPGAVVIGLRTASVPNAAQWDSHAWLVGSTGVIAGGGQLESAGWVPASAFTGAGWSERAKSD